jgi:hypothetical protein
VNSIESSLFGEFNNG